MSALPLRPRDSAAGSVAACAADLFVAAGVWRVMAGLLEWPGFRAAIRHPAWPGGWGTLAYWLAASAALAFGLRRLAKWSAGPEASRGAEALRLVVLAGVVGWAFKFLFTSEFAGGLDARWYGYTMIDTLAQARAGHWPVFVSQGEFQWNGAVHPIRTAPYLLNFGILADLLTLRRLTPLGVLHLTVAAALVQATLLCYVLLARCAPAARWLAWVAALGWALAPMAMGYVVGQEMFMTVMALAWLPLVYYANARLVERDDGTAWACLAAGLALVWMSHAAVAAWATAITALIQGLRLLLRDFSGGAWWRAFRGGLLFAGLGAYYFCSMAEVAPAGARSAPAALAAALLALAGLAAVLRLLAGGSRVWWAPAMAALGALWFCGRWHFNWLGGLLVWVAFARGWQRWRGPDRPLPRLPEIAVAGILTAVYAALLFPVPILPADWARDLQAAEMMGPLVPGIFRPVSPHAVLLTDLQLGCALWAALGCGCLLAWWRGGWSARLFALAAVCCVPLVAPVPGLTSSLMYAVPDWLYGVSSISLWMRILPNLSLLAVFTLFLALAPRWPRRGANRWIAGTALAAAALALVVWDRRELGKWRVRADLSVNAPDGTAGFYRQDTAQLYSYSYDSLTKPGYLLNGAADYHLESHLLRAPDLRLLPEPLLDAPSATAITLVAGPDPRGPNWFHLTPSLTVPPGAGLILKFQFFDRPYDGTLLLQGPRSFYRTYYFPNAGFEDKSFGVAPARPKTLAVWNRQTDAQEVNLTFLAADAQPLFGNFARVLVQPYRPEDLRIRTLGLVPYHATVRAPEAAFLETPRAYIPGYRARVDGRPAPVAMSPDHLVMVRLEAGFHDVVVAYRPTLKLSFALGLSLLCWIGLGVRTWRKPAQAAPPGLPSR